MADPSARTIGDGGAGDSVQLFRELWATGKPPELVAFLTTVRHLTPARLTEILRIEQQGRWRRGEHVPAETYLDRFPTVRNNLEDALVLIYGEVLLRNEQGEQPTLAEYEERFPQLTEQLRLQFALHEAIHGTDSSIQDPQLPAASERTPPEPRPLRRRKWPQIPGYAILGELGRGGMGVVYRARDVHLGRLVAIKMVRTASEIGPIELVRFQQEAELVARLHHSNIVQIYEVGVYEGRSYLALELVDGPSLAQLCAGIPQPPREAALFTAELARAVAHAHAHGIIHRDLKPGNILMHIADLKWHEEGSELAAPLRPTSGAGLLPASGREDIHAGTSTSLILRAAVPKITDFGLARRVETESGLTQTGAIIGTPSYMAPEQADGQGQRITPATDIYALGAILYELLTGRPPFRSTTPLDTVMQVRFDDPVPPRRFQAKVPRDLETITLKCLNKDSTRRYTSANALADDLVRFLNDQPILARPAGTLERGWRWCRRNPRVAGLLLAVGVLFSALVAGGVVGLVWLQQATQRAETALHEAAAGQRQAEKGRQAAEARLWAILLEQARARRLSRQPGQRYRALAAIREALTLPVPEGRSRTELRHEAVAALVLPDLEPDREVPLPPGTTLVALDPHFRQLAAATAAGRIEVQSLDENAAGKKSKCTLESAGSTPGAIVALEFSPDSQFLHALSKKETKQAGKVWKMGNGEPQLILEGTWDRLAFRNDGAEVAVTRGNTVYVHEARTGAENRALKTALSNLEEVAWNPKRPLLAVGAKAQVVLLDSETGKVVWEVAVPKEVAVLAWHPEGRLLAVGDGQGRIQLWDTAHQRPALQPLEGERAGTPRICFSHSGARLLSSAGSGRWRLWDTRTGQLLLTQPTNGNCLQFQHDDALIAGDVLNDCLRLFRFQAGAEVLAVHPWPGSEVQGLQTLSPSVLHPEGRLLAVPVRNGICLIDVLRGEAVAAWQAPGKWLLGWEKDGSLLTTGTLDHNHRWPLTRLPDGSLRLGPAVQVPCEPQQLFPKLDQRKPVPAPDRGLEAVIGPGCIRLREPGSGRELACLTSPEPTRLLPCCFTPDGSRLVARGIETNQVYIFDLRALRLHLRRLELDWDPSPLSVALPRPPVLKVEWVE